MYKPDEQYRPYDGRLDGQRFAFALYNLKPGLAGLWGTEAMYRAVLDGKTLELGPELVEGSFPWAFWREV